VLTLPDHIAILSRVYWSFELNAVSNAVYKLRDGVFAIMAPSKNFMHGETIT